MQDKNNSPYTLTPEQNARNIDILGQFLFTALSASMASGKSVIEPKHLMDMLRIVADCRVYTSIRDRDLLKDENTRKIVDEHDNLVHQDEVRKDAGSIDDAVNSILDDLRKNNIIA